MFLPVTGGVLFHKVNTVRSAEPLRPAVRTQARIRHSGENGLAKYEALVIMAGSTPPSQQEIYRPGRGKGKNYPVNQSGSPGT